MKFYYAVLISYASILPAIGMEHNQDPESDPREKSSIQKKKGGDKSIWNIFGWMIQGQTESVVPACRMTSDGEIFFKNELDEPVFFPKPNLDNQKDSSQEHQDPCDPSKRHSVSLVSQYLPSQKIHQIELEKWGLFCKGCGFYHTMPPEENTGSTNSIKPPIGVPLELHFLDLEEYGKVLTLNKLCQLTHDLSSDIQNKPHEALMALFGSEGKIKGLWETGWSEFDYYGESPYTLGALYNRMERYIEEPQKKHTIIKFHIELVKSIAEELFLCRKKNIIDESINTEIKDNVNLFASHMKILSNVRFSPKNLQTKNIQTEMILNDYRKWLGDIKAKTSKGDLLSEAYSGLYDWEEIHTSKLVIEPPLLRMNY